MAGFDKLFHALVDIAHKNHGSVGADGITTTRKRAGGHVVLHDLHAVLVLEVDPRHFIKGNAIP